MPLEILLQIARRSLESYFEDNVVLKKDELIKEYPVLKELGASFVTLTKDGHLRGCIGTLIAHENLYDNVFENARKAAFGDPRFDSLSLEELNQIDIEVSVLSTPKPLEYVGIEDLKDKLIPHRYGVILKHHSHQATFLPQVWEQLPVFEDFMLHLCYKAGLNLSCLNEGAQVYIYEVDKVKEQGC